MAQTFYYFRLRETTLFKRVQRLSHKFPVITYSDPEKKKKKYIFIFIIFNFKGLFFGTMKPPIISDPGVWCVHCMFVSQSIRYLVVYLDLCKCVVVSQRINQSLHPCPSDEVGFQVQTLQCLVRPQHVTERLGGGTRK